VRNPLMLGYGAFAQMAHGGHEETGDEGLTKALTVSFA
jgi:hypothetical protein